MTVRWQLASNRFGRYQRRHLARLLPNKLEGLILGGLDLAAEPVAISLDVRLGLGQHGFPKLLTIPASRVEGKPRLVGDLGPLASEMVAKIARLFARPLG